MKYHKMVWEFRRQMVAYWPTPDTVDAARFAVTEIGEAMDAFLRLDGGYARNRERSPDVLDELADTAMMILTAIGERANLSAWAEMWDDEDVGVGEMYADLDEIDALVMTVKDFYAVAVSPQPSPVSMAGFGGLAVLRIAEHAGMDLEKRLRQRMDRIFRKNHPDGQRLAQVEKERNGQPPAGTRVDVPDLSEEHNVYVYRSETPGVYAVDDFAGYHPE